MTNNANPPAGAREAPVNEVREADVPEIEPVSVADPVATFEAERARRRLLARDGGLEGQAHRLSHVEQHPAHTKGI
jgi:hypothetical protein